MRTLEVTSPPMSGDDVAKIQARLGVEPSGVYDDVTSAAVKAWKWRVGGNLNQHWVGSVTRFYAQLGGRDAHDAVVKTRP